MHYDYTPTHRLTVTGIDPSGATHTATATWYEPDPQPAELARTQRPKGRAKAAKPSGYYVFTLQTDSELHRLQLHGSTILKQCQPSTLMKPELPQQHQHAP